MTNSEVARAAFSDAPPVAYLLRRARPNRWLRIHSLPDAKRYPTTPDDERELLRRHARAADVMLGSSAERALVVTYNNGYRGKDEPPSLMRLGPEVSTGWAERWESDVRYADDLEDAAFAVAMLEPGRLLTPIVLDVAHGRTASLLFVALPTGRIYAPYDGGADLLFETMEARDAARSEFAGWTSRRPDGL